MLTHYVTDLIFSFTFISMVLCVPHLHDFDMLEDVVKGCGYLGTYK